MKKSFIALGALALFGCSFASGKMNSSLQIDNYNRALQTNRAYTSDYDAKEDALKKGLEINEQIAEEGMVLLKNENNALPLSAKKGTLASHVTVFGYASFNPTGGGSSSGDASGGIAKLTATIYSSLADANIVVNPTVKKAYTGWLAETVTGTNSYGQTVQVPKYGSDLALDGIIEENKTTLEDSYGSYSDAAILVFTNGTGTERAHRMALDQEQYDLVDYAASKFGKVIVLINNSTPIEIKKLKDNVNVDSILVIGEPGDNGFEAVGKILNGTVNPSGHLSDTYSADFTKDPSFNNINLTGAADGNPQYTVNGEKKNSYFRDYDEGIYTGYRYYETAYAEKLAGNYADFEYDSAVAYPFGHGLSYTDFKWSLVSTSGTLEKNASLSFNVKVTNDGETAGKDVVELFYHAPYITGGIEKSDVVLGDYAKTDLLKPGESQIVNLEVDVNDLASYDYKTDKTYVLDAGDYVFSLRTDAHTVKKNADSEDLKVTKNLAAKALVNTSVTGYTVTNQFQDVTDGGNEHGVGTFSRANFTTTWPAAPTAEEHVLTAEQFKALETVVTKEYDTGSKWEETTMPAYSDPDTRPATAAVKLADLTGADYDDPKWDTLLDELSLDEMNNLITNAGFRTESIDYIGKPYSLDTDGPKGWTGTGTSGTRFNAFAAEPVIAATWNKELAYDMGKIVGDQGIWGCLDRTDTAAGGKIYGYTGWYAPGMNLHRSPFDGRFNEYFSEDPVLTGNTVANQSLGIKSKGGYVFLKHFAVHEDGGGVGISMSGGSFKITGYRGGAEATSGTCYWLTEQAMRELYLKPFQIAVEDGQAGAVMSSFSRLGTTWAGASYSLLTECLRNEWGFKGYVVTDIDIYGFLNVDQMIRAGGDCLLTSSITSNKRRCGTTDYTSLDNPTATQIAAMRRATKSILYTVGNSHAMDVPMGAKVNYAAENSIVSGEVGAALDIDCSDTSLNTKYNYSPITYTAETLPEGLTLDAATGHITGTVATAGLYSIDVVAAADGYESATKQILVSVNDGSKTISEQITDLEAQIEALKTKLDTTNADKTALETKITELQAKIAALEAKPETKIDNTGLITGIVIVGVLAAAAVALGLLNLLKKKN
ncbi:MAG: glycoside hydrolase family 3 C-terminal domain-containing protein [Bacilli bacterium]